MDLVLKLNEQLKETKKELDSLIQLKQTDIASTSASVIPTVSTTVPSTLAASLAPTAPLATTLPVTVEYNNRCIKRKSSRVHNSKCIRRKSSRVG